MELSSKAKIVYHQIDKQTTKLGDLRKMAKELKVDHDLAMELWFTKEFLPNYFIQINQNSLEKKLKAMKCYKSEIAKHPFSRSLVNIKNLAMHRGSQSGNYFAEAFKIIRLIEKKR